MATISVIIPAYNAARTIRATIHSVLMQTCADFELIVVDDGSIDGTGAIVEGIDDQRITLHRRRHRGLTASRNFGIGCVRGDYISFLDADDIWLPEKLERQLEALRLNPEAGVAYGWTVLLDENRRFLCPMACVPYEGDVYADLLVDCFIASGSNMMMRRQCIESVGLFKRKRGGVSDWDFFLRLAGKWSFALVPAYLVGYRLSTDSISSAVEMTAGRMSMFAQEAYDQADVSLQSLKPRTYANIYLHLAFLYLLRTPTFARVPKGFRSLVMAARSSHRVLGMKRFWLLAAAGVLQLFIPAPLQLPAARSLLRIYGRWVQMKSRVVSIRVG